MRVFIAGLQTETNTFAPLPTGWRGFEDIGLYYGDGSSRQDDLAGLIAAGMRRLLEGAGHQVVESVSAYAQPSGKTLDGVYTALRDRIIADLKAALPVDIVFLWLHGAMVAMSEDDCEGDILAAVRAVVGPDVPVGSMLDPHCHLTSRMVANADVLVCMKEYPHTDGFERAPELLRILEQTRREEVRPVQAVADTDMVGFYPTTTEPMAGFVRRQKAVEQRPGILSVSLGHGFPWADVAEVGTRVLVVADGDHALARATARELADEFYGLRESLRVRHASVEEALNRAAAVRGLAVLADAADNAGGGAPSDNTTLLRAMIRRRFAPSAVGAIHDPQAVETCFEAGVGSAFTLRIGGKLGPASGDPLDAPIVVRALVDDLRPKDLGSQPMGRSARVEIDGIQIVLCSKRVQTFSPIPFEALGIDLQSLRAVVVKSSQHFHQAFAPIAADIIHVAADGALDMRFETLPYTKRSPRYWPRCDDPGSSLS